MLLVVGSYEQMLLGYDLLNNGKSGEVCRVCPHAILSLNEALTIQKPKVESI